MGMKDDDEEEKETAYVGRAVKKFFSGFGFFHGKVISYNRSLRFYKVKYDDGDREEVDLKELRAILVSKESMPPSPAPEEKPKSAGRRGRKRRRDTGEEGVSEAGNEDTGTRKDPGHGFTREMTIAETEEVRTSSKAEPASEHVPGRWIERRSEGTAMGSRADQQADERAPLNGVGHGHHPAEETVLENGFDGDCRNQSLLGHAAPPCLKRTRVTPSSDACLQQQLPSEDDGVGEDQEGMFGTVRKLKDSFLSVADLPSPPLLFEEDLRKMECENDVESGNEDEIVVGGGFRDEPTWIPPAFSLPPSFKPLEALEDSVAELIQVYSALRSFSNVVFLSPFSLEELVFALSMTDVCSLTDGVHLSLLQTLRRQLERQSKNGSKSATFTLRLSDWSLLDYITWPSFLVKYLLTQGFYLDQGKAFAKSEILATEYYKLPIRTKLTILSFLCDKVLDSEEARAELTRRAMLVNDPEMADMKGSWQMKQVKQSSGSAEAEQDERVGELCSRLEKDAVPAAQAVGQGNSSAATAASSIRVGRHLDEDGNLDECVLCAMDGNLICCDGCPAAYHSRCVGVTRQGLPPGDWFCPECRADKQDPRGALISKGIRGAELLAVGPDGRLFFGICGYLLISEMGADGDAVSRYYSPQDLHEVIKLVDQAGPMYSQVQIAIYEHFLVNTEKVLTTPLADQRGHAAERGVRLSNGSFLDKEARCFETQCYSVGPGAELPMAAGIATNSLKCEPTKEATLNHSSPRELRSCESAKASDPNQLDKEVQEKGDVYAFSEWKQANGFKMDSAFVGICPGEDEKNPSVSCDETKNIINGQRLSHSFVNSASNAESNSTGLNADQPYILQKAIGVIPFTSQSDEPRVSELSGAQDSQLLHSSDAGSLPPCLDGTDSTIVAGKGIGAALQVKKEEGCELETKGPPATPSSGQPLGLQANGRSCSVTWQQGSRPAKAGRNPADDFLSAVTQIGACGYTNKYANCDFVATAAFKLAVMAGGVDDLVDDKSGPLKKTKPSSVADQLKALTQASGHFIWPSLKKRAKDFPREKCGWCINCRFNGRRACLLTQVMGQMAGGAALVLGGIRPSKLGYGHFPVVSAYILYMEENLLGLLGGPWETVDHRKKWRRHVEQAKSVKAVRDCLLEMETNLRKVALSPDWEKLEEDAPEAIASSAMILSLTGQSMGKKTSSRKRGRPPIVAKAPCGITYDGACFGVMWWRGGRLSRQVYNWESLNRRTIKRAGRRGGFREIPDIIYSKGLDLPRRSRRFAWRTRLEKITSIAQIALEVRHLDTFIRWNDIISPLQASTTHSIKAAPDSDPALWKAEIQEKSEEDGTVKYLLGFDIKDAGTSSTKDPHTELIDENSAKDDANTVEKPKKQLAVSKDVSKECSKEDMWTAETEVPLFLLKEFEEKMRSIRQSKQPKVPNKGKGKVTSQQKRSSFWKMLCSPLSPKLQEDKVSSSWICGSCQLDGPECQRVTCLKCSGEFHKSCTQFENAVIDGHESQYPVCKQCVKQRPGQRTRKPSYKMMVMQSQLADDSSPGACKREAAEAGSPADTDNMVGGDKARHKREQAASTAAQASEEPFGKRRGYSLLSGSARRGGSSNNQTKAASSKKMGLITIVPSQQEGESIQGEESAAKKNKSFRVRVSQLGDVEGHDLRQPKKKRGRKKKIESLARNQSQAEEETPLSVGRRASERMSNGESPPNVVIPLLGYVPGHESRRRGRPKSAHKLGKDLHASASMLKRRSGGHSWDGSPGSAPHTKESTEADNKSPVKRKRLKIIFAGLEVKSRGANKHIVVGEEQPRKSGNGLDFGTRSGKSVADVERFRHERVIPVGQEKLEGGNAPVCGLCATAHSPGQVFVGCEYCGEWFHGDAVGLKPGDAAFLWGFKCHRCRKCRAPSCPLVQSAGPGTAPAPARGAKNRRRRGDIDHGEVIDADNVDRSRFGCNAGSSGSDSDTSSWLNSPEADEKEFLAFNDAKAFPDFVAATNQAEEALAADGSDFGHDVLSRDFDMSELGLPEESQLPLNLGDQSGNVWAGDSSVPLDLPTLSVSNPGISPVAGQSLSFTELLASEDDYFAGVTGSELGLGGVWSGGLYDSSNLRVPTAAGGAAVEPAAVGGAGAAAQAKVDYNLNVGVDYNASQENANARSEIGCSDKLGKTEDPFNDSVAAASVQEADSDGVTAATVK